MRNFDFQNTTRLVFGRGMISELPKLIARETKVMITFGGGSVKANGVYDQVIASLKGYSIVEFWGIEPNPRYETLMRAVDLARKENVELLLSVGGGSCLDGTKFIAAAVPYVGEPWNFLRGTEVEVALPIGCVLTLPATGSEMNGNAVISREATKEKFALHSSKVYPQFSILDPQTTYSLPPYQVACGVVDTFIHTMEQYLTYPVGTKLMDRWAEGILQTLVEIAPKLSETPKDYDTMAEFMLSATMGLNGFIAMGVVEDWATHMIGHEITALTEITHGHTLSIIFPALIRIMRESKCEKLLQYGERVWGIVEGDSESRLEQTAQKTEAFFRSLGLKTRLRENGVDESVIDQVVSRFTERGVVLGERRNITPEVVGEILRKAL